MSFIVLHCVLGKVTPPPQNALQVEEMAKLVTEGFVTSEGVTAVRTLEKFTDANTYADVANKLAEGNAQLYRRAPMFGVYTWVGPIDQGKPIDFEAVKKSDGTDATNGDGQVLKVCILGVEKITVGASSPDVPFTKTETGVAEVTGLLLDFKIFLSQEVPTDQEHMSSLNVSSGLSDVSRMFVRQSYKGLYKVIWTLAATGGLYFHICGNPGIGKSVSLWYFAFWLLRQQTVSAVGIRTADMKFVAEKWEASIRVYDLKLQPEKKSLLKRPDAWMLLDQAHTPGEDCGTFTVLFAAPDARNWKEFSKIRSSHFYQRFMPLWSNDELLALRGMNYPAAKLEVIEERLSWFGPIPRIIFAPEVKNSYSQLRSKVRATKWRDIAVWLDGLDSSTENLKFSHIAFILEVTEGFEPKEFKFASKHVEELFFESTELEAIQEIVSRIIDGNTTLMATVRGKCLEYYAHLFLSSACSVKLRCLSHRTPDVDWRTNKRKMVTFRNLDDLHATGGLEKLYLKPLSKNFESIDAILPNEVVIQVSAGVKKAIKRRGLESCLEFLRTCKSGGQKHLIFVTVLDKVEDCKEVPQVAKHSNGVRRRVNGTSSDLVQWVCEIDPTPSEYLQLEQIRKQIRERDADATPICPVQADSLDGDAGGDAMEEEFNEVVEGRLAGRQ